MADIEQHQQYPEQSCGFSSLVNAYDTSKEGMAISNSCAMGGSCFHSPSPGNHVTCDGQAQPNHNPPSSAADLQFTDHRLGSSSGAQGSGMHGVCLQQPQQNEQSHGDAGALHASQPMPAGSEPHGLISAFDYRTGSTFSDMCDVLTGPSDIYPGANPENLPDLQETVTASQAQAPAPSNSALQSLQETSHGMALQQVPGGQIASLDGFGVSDQQSLKSSGIAIAMANNWYHQQDLGPSSMSQQMQIPNGNQGLQAPQLQMLQQQQQQQLAGMTQAQAETQQNAAMQQQQQQQQQRHSANQGMLLSHEDVICVSHSLAQFNNSQHQHMGAMLSSNGQSQQCVSADQQNIHSAFLRPLARKEESFGSMPHVQQSMHGEGDKSVDLSSSGPPGPSPQGGAGPNPPGSHGSQDQPSHLQQQTAPSNREGVTHDGGMQLQQANQALTAPSASQGINLQGQPAADTHQHLLHGQPALLQQLLPQNPNQMQQAVQLQQHAQAQAAAAIAQMQSPQLPGGSSLMLPQGSATSQGLQAAMAMQAMQQQQQQQQQAQISSYLHSQQFTSQAAVAQQAGLTAHGMMANPSIPPCGMMQEVKSSDPGLIGPPPPVHANMHMPHVSSHNSIPQRSALSHGGSGGSLSQNAMGQHPSCSSFSQQAPPSIHQHVQNPMHILGGSQPGIPQQIQSSAPDAGMPLAANVSQMSHLQMQQQQQQQQGISHPHVMQQPNHMKPGTIAGMGQPGSDIPKGIPAHHGPSLSVQQAMIINAAAAAAAGQQMPQNVLALAQQQGILPSGMFNQGSSLPNQAVPVIVSDQMNSLGNVQLPSMPLMAQQIMKSSLMQHTPSAMTEQSGDSAHASKFRGVQWDHTNMAWHAVFVDGSSTKSLGHFTSDEEAALAWDREVVARHGKSAMNLNFPSKVLEHPVPAEEQPAVASSRPTSPRPEPYRSSKYRGVSRGRGKKKWRAMIQHQKKQIHVGYYDTGWEAARAYDREAVKLLGEDAVTNFPIEDYHPILTDKGRQGLPGEPMPDFVEMEDDNEADGDEDDGMDEDDEQSSNPGNRSGNDGANGPDSAGGGFQSDRLQQLEYPDSLNGVSSAVQPPPGTEMVLANPGQGLPCQSEPVASNTSLGTPAQQLALQQPALPSGHPPGRMVPEPPPESAPQAESLQGMLTGLGRSELWGVKMEGNSWRAQITIDLGLYSTAAEAARAHDRAAMWTLGVTAKTNLAKGRELLSMAEGGTLGEKRIMEPSTDAGVSPLYPLSGRGPFPLLPLGLACWLLLSPRPICRKQRTQHPSPHDQPSAHRSHYSVVSQV